MKHLILILLALCLFSCKTAQKTVSGAKLNEEINISNDVSDEKQINDLADRVIQRIINEETEISIENVKYDTEKPDSITGKYPISEETKIRIRTEISVNEIDSAHQEVVSVAKINDNSQIVSATKIETKEEKQIGLKGWQKTLITIGGIVIAGAFLFIAFKICKILTK